MESVMGIVGTDPLKVSHRSMTQSTGSKRSAVKEHERLTARLRPKEPPMYYGKTLREHQTWTHNVTLAFTVWPNLFMTEESKVNYATQYINVDTKDHWFH